MNGRSVSETYVWPPTSCNINVCYNGQKYPTHYLPDKSSDRKATAIEIKEIQCFSKFFGTEYVEDYGYIDRSLPTHMRRRAMQLIDILYIRSRNPLRQKMRMWK